MRKAAVELFKIMLYAYKTGESKMGKKIYTVDGHLYIVDDETGKVKEVIIKDTTIPAETLEKLIKILATEANRDN